MIVEGLILLLLGLGIRNVYKNIVFCKKLNGFNWVPGWPIIGSVLDFRNPKESWDTVLRYFKQCGDNALLKIGSEITLLTADPLTTEFLLSSNKLIDKSPDYRFFGRWFGQGLLTATGYKWRNHRKILTPSFHYGILQDFIDVFDKASHVLVQKLEKEIENYSFDVYQYITMCTLDVICETAMGTTVNAQEYPDSEYVRSVKVMCDVIYKRIFGFIENIDALYRFTSLYRRETKALKVIHGLTNDVIKQRKEALKTEAGAIEASLNEAGMKRRTSFLDTLLKCTIDDKPLSDDDIREEVDTFMFEGHDTTAVCIGFTIYLLSKHLDIQEKVHDEITSLLGNNKERPVTFEILQKMKYLEMVIKETLRLYPSVPAFARAIKEDIEYGNAILPKGLKVAIVAYALHRNERIYPDPEKFDPERFNSERTSHKNPFAYVPFSAGPRNCIGQKFALLELKSTISKIIRYYRLLPAIPEHVVSPTNIVTSYSVNGVRIRLEKRE